MFKKFFKELIEYIKEEKFFLIGLALFFIIFNYPVDYYIITGGGASDVGSRIKIENAYESKGSFNMCYVTELKATLGLYLLSYIIPNWDLDKISNYQYDENESIETIDFRGELDLKESNSAATKWAYELANKEVEEKSSTIYVIATFEEYKTPLKVKDEIISIDNEKIDSNEQYKNILSKYKKGDVIKVKVKRNNKIKELDCKLHESEGVTILGVVLQNYTSYKTNPKLEINFKKTESGPSAGLITTLDIYNKLTKKDLTNLKVAGTGTIELDGSIGTIGGVKYKLIGAAKKKMDIFLVPSGENYEEAIKVKKEKKLDIKVIGVKTIQEAISTLEKLNKTN